MEAGGGAGDLTARAEGAVPFDCLCRFSRHMRARCGLVFLLFLAVPTAASAAQGPLLSLTPERVSSDRVALAGQPWRVRVVMQPWVAGQTATVRFYRHGHKLRAVNVNLQMSPTGKSGFALVAFSTSLAGSVQIKATHLATPTAQQLLAKPVRVNVAALHAGPGARGPAVRLLQQSLAKLGYVVGKRGLFDDRTARAVLAFRKVTGMARTTTASADVFRSLAHGKGAFHVRHPDHGKHVEADLSLQVLALIRGARVERIYPLSSGKPSTPTVQGSFRVYSKTPGFNAKGMYFSNYFIRGFAIHGYAEVPVFAASHGCLRVPIPDAIPIYSWIKIGDIVDVYP
jgi:peptidoglycan hydrolase-like protein with peptidoglycan-binding domain